MKYLALHFHIQCDENLLVAARELLAVTAAEAGCESFEDTGDGLKAYVQKDAFREDALQEGVRNFFLQDVGITWDVEQAADEDWNSTWEEEGFSPIVIAGRLTVADYRHPERCPEEDRQSGNVVWIDARNAFGTGTHETTRMMLTALTAMNLAGKKVLDCGCGTGILGIAASMRGALSVTAYDIDSWSVENTRHNAAINGAGGITAMEGDASVLKGDMRFDVVMANINRNILLQDMPRFRQVMNDDALLLISGFYESDIPLLLEKARTLGLEETERDAEGDWRMLVFRTQ